MATATPAGFLKELWVRFTLCPWCVFFCWARKYQWAGEKYAWLRRVDDILR